MKKLILLIFLLFNIAMLWSQGPKIFPGAVGYGTNSRGAYQPYYESGDPNDLPQILYVDTVYAGSYNSSDTTGSMEWAFKKDTARIVIFLVGGVIDYSGVTQRFFTMSNPYINVYGQTAPSPGIFLKSCTIFADGDFHDGLFQHFSIFYGDWPRPNGEIQVGDCWSTLSGSYNIVLSNMSMAWGNDETLSSNSDSSTTDRTIVYEGLRRNYHVDEGNGYPEYHDKQTLYTGDYNATFYLSMWVYASERLPLCRTDSIQLINNYSKGFATTGPDFNSSSGNGHNNAAFVGNYFYQTPGKDEVKGEYYCFLRSTIDPDSKIYFEDNTCYRLDTNRVENGGVGGLTQRDVIFSDGTTPTERIDSVYTDNPDSNRIDISEFDIIPVEDVFDSIKANSGARPWDRSYFDSLQFVKLEDNTQDYIDSPRDQPGKAYNEDPNVGCQCANGDMENGYDFSANPASFSVNGTSISISNNITTLQGVLDTLNNQLPAGTEAIKHPNPLSNYIIIQTTTTGASESITIAGDAVTAFGISNGTYYGQDAEYIDLDYAQTTHSLDVPTDPHGNSGFDNYTNIQYWADTIQGQSSPASPDSCLSLSVSGVVTDEFNSGANGAINTTTTGGTTPYTFDWDDGPTTEDRTGLSAGAYKIVVTDDIGCKDSADFTVNNILLGDTVLTNKFRVNFAPSSHSYTGDGTWNNKVVNSLTDSIQLVDTTGTLTDKYLKNTTTNWSGPSSTLGQSKAGYDDSVAVSMWLAYSQIDRSERPIVITNFTDSLAYAQFYCVRTPSASYRRTTIRTNLDTITINSATSTDFGYINAKPDENNNLYFYISPWTETGVDSSDYIYLNFVEIETYTIEEIIPPREIDYKPHIDKNHEIVIDKNGNIVLSKY